MALWVLSWVRSSRVGLVKYINGRWRKHSPPSALQCIALAVNTRASRGKGGRRGRMAAGGAAFDEGPTQGKTGQGQGQGQNYDLALIARASEKFVDGAGEFVKTILV